MIYLLTAIIAIPLMVAIVFRIRQLRPTKLTSIALANQLLRQPERFFIIVPWYLAEFRQHEKDLAKDPLALFEEAARHWRKIGNFDLPARTLVAIAKLEADSTQANLQALLSLLFGNEPNPLMGEDAETGYNQKLAVMCFKVVKVAVERRTEIPDTKIKGKLPKEDDVQELLAKARKTEGVKSKLTHRVFGNFEDLRILDQWRTLLIFASNDARTPEKNKEHYPNDSVRYKQGKLHPSEAGYSHLWFIRRALLDCSLGAKDNGTSK